MSFFPELYFNVDNGYLEGLVRGLKAGVLSQADYLNLVQCETLEGMDGATRDARGTCP
ncbi:ATP6V0D1 isoform 2 [Pan troglodytes]|uniref:ATPase H+ transporting V0 subunit d1 n=4 Tax=Simiiformes TaxID=314293 RepID=H3BTB5_HUMAN|nr:ATPase H+ transporting V0 subunit d1 [Homo sapiens]KAI4055550.1 ATPase H+ transporting V0 subunit d1 [Homo sapiens]PNI91218.1 ATP6V0D1 isoform 2 [Pan troglodytes]PNJ61287.1 ATP6V0D1 isoform 11 [Pongo abelii]